MEGVDEALYAVGAGERPATFDRFAAAIDPDWIAAALAQTGTASVRRRKLPAADVVWLVIGMGLFRDRPIAQIVDDLALVLPGPDGGRRQVTNGAVVRARDKLGPQPLALLFADTAATWTAEVLATARWRDLAVFGLDGTTLRVPDTAANDAAFGRPGISRGGTAGYPQLRLVTLLGLRHRLVAAAALGPYTTSEGALAQRLWATLPPRSLVILDRGFAGYARFHHLTDLAQQRHWLIRARSGTWALQWTVHTRLGRGDTLVQLRASQRSRRTHPDLPRTTLARAVEVRRRGFRPSTLLTSLLDPQAYPAADLARLYHERWELELAFDEVKTHTLERVETLRSQTPARVEQEVWGLLLAYNLVRRALSRAAPRAGVPPGRLSYRHAVLVLRTFWLTTPLTSPATLPRRLARLFDDLRLAVLPPRRPRRYPRAVKLKLSAYPRKRPVPRPRRVK
jgi:hypothetical protein